MSCMREMSARLDELVKAWLQSEDQGWHGEQLYPMARCVSGHSPVLPVGGGPRLLF